jgi:hypothetical protein
MLKDRFFFVKMTRSFSAEGGRCGNIKLVLTTVLPRGNEVCTHRDFGDHNISTNLVILNEVFFTRTNIDP